MRNTTYPLKQKQYTRIYQASERTMRTWMKKGAPLNDPAAMLETFLCHQHSTPVAAQKLAEREQVQARYQQEFDLAAEAVAIRDALGEWIADLEGALGLARDFARSTSQRIGSKWWDAATSSQGRLSTSTSWQASTETMMTMTTHLSSRCGQI